MASLMGEVTDNAMRELQQNKMRYCMHKDDLVIGLGRPMYGASINNTRKKAYPSVIVTLANMEKEALKWIAFNNFYVSDYMMSAQLKKKFIKAACGGLNGRTNVVVDDDLQAAINIFSSDPTKQKRLQSQIDNLLQFYFVGVSLGLAYAHPHSGDTVASVMIGGLRTVLNGHFQVHTNDLLMFYWDCELDLFDENGGRKDRRILSMDNDPTQPSFEKLAMWMTDDTLAKSIVPSNTMNKNTKERQAYYARQQGTYPANGPHGPMKGKINVAYIKPYITSSYPDPVTGGPQHFPMDRCRVFGKAISNAQPFEPVDIMLSRQAI